MSDAKKTNENKSKQLPKFTKGEEIFNAVSHIVGASFGLFVFVYGIVISALQYDVYKLVSMIIYGLSIVILYTMSTLYHFLPKGNAKKVFRIFDHCTIFLLIAGSYTPFCLVVLKNVGCVGWVLFGLQWGLAILGITFNAINMHWLPVRIFSQVSYIIMGWSILFFAPSLFKNLALTGFILLLVGGLMYTIGIIYFALGMKRKYNHSIWHLFCLAGTFFQFLCIALYVL